MEPKYYNILSPLEIGKTGVILRNRLHNSNAVPHFLQGPEPFPAEPMVTHYVNTAKNGAGIVTFRPSEHELPRQKIGGVDAKHMPIYDHDNLAVENSFSLIADAVHFYGSKIIVARRFAPEGYGISNAVFQTHMGPITVKEATEDVMLEMVEQAVKEANYYKNLGFDGMFLFSSLSHSSLSPSENHRTDKYGGSLENRARLPLMMFDAVKKSCGKDFIIETVIGTSSVYKDFDLPLEDLVEYSKMIEGYVDILQIRPSGPFGSASHTTGYNLGRDEDPEAIRYAMMVKEGGAKVLTAPNTSFQSLEKAEEYIRDGKTDLISMGRSFICDPEYGKKAYEGRGEDVVPCVRCNKCHVPTLTGPWVSICTVNPKHGLADRIHRMVEAPVQVKKVAVVGGGPAGLKAALEAAERGHDVTLYEKTGYLGGQLSHAEYASFKWTLVEFKNYLVRQLNKHGVKILLNTAASPELIKEAGYDVVLAAVGATANVPNIPGATGENVWAPLDVFPNPDALGKKVVIVGGAETGTETGIYLARLGHDVTVLTRQGKLAHDATPIHYVEHLIEAWEKLPNFSFFTEATTTAISADGVTFVDKEGVEHFVNADSVVLSGGMNPCRKEALSFYGSASRFFAIGDCDKVGNVQKCMRSAFAAASSI